jgi:response regulator RpfG family c-di-GMP phosphodiesterase
MSAWTAPVTLFILPPQTFLIRSRILAIADIFDALTAADRPYRSSYDIEKALKMLQEEAAKGKLDKDLVDLFISRQVYDVIIGGQDDSGM